MPELFKMYQLRSISLTTVTNWMHRLGFKYRPRQKSYYVDNHERPDIVMYRGKYNTRYFCSELDCFRWIQLTKKQVSDYKMEIKRAHEYLDEDGITKYEYHVDDYPSVSDLVVDNPFGGNLSIRKDPDKKA